MMERGKEQGQIVVTLMNRIAMNTCDSELNFADFRQMFSVLNEINNNSHFRTTSVVVTSIGTACFVYILVAITGYLSYGDNVGGNIVAMYPPSVPATIGRAAIVVLVMFSYPLQVHPCRASIDGILSWRPQRTRSEEGSPSRSSLPGVIKREKKAEMTDTRFAAITSLIIICSYIVAMTVSSLEKVLAYVGSTGSTSISFILPGLFYYKISSPDSPLHQALLKEDDDEDYESGDDGDDEGGSLLQAKRWFRSKNLLRKLSLALAIYGAVVMIVCLTTNTFFIGKGH